jgi:cell division protein ZapD
MINAKDVVYEYALTPLASHALNFEWLYQNITCQLEGHSPVQCEAALDNLIKLIAIIDKPELKSKYIQFYLKLEQVLTKFAKEKAIDPVKLDSLLSSIAGQLKCLSQQSAKFSHELLSEHFIATNYERYKNKGFQEKGPSYYLQNWLGRGGLSCQNDLKRWVSHLSNISMIISTKLSLIREFGSFQEFCVSNGFLQLPVQNAVSHLVRISLPSTHELYPDIRAGHHGISLQLLNTDFIKPSHKITQKVMVKLALCKL